MGRTVDGARQRAARLSITHNRIPLLTRNKTDGYIGPTFPRDVLRLASEAEAV